MMEEGFPKGEGNKGTEVTSGNITYQHGEAGPKPDVGDDGERGSEVAVEPGDRTADVGLVGEERKEGRK